MSDGIRATFQGDLGSFRLDADFTAPGRGVTALFGPSGCGKTTVLRCLAGLTRLAGGNLSVDGRTWQEGEHFVPPHRRPIGYVFQEANLFPHLSVKGNLIFGKGRDRGGDGARGPGLGEVTDLLGLEGLLERSPARLSGGERQRVAIGRALLSEPRLLLMDEPLAALDRFSKDEIIPYLERLHDTLSIPVIYVSHDVNEVERLADFMIMMEDGRVRAAGPLADVLADGGLPLARTPQAGTVLTARVRDFDAHYGLSLMEVAGETLVVGGRVGAHGTEHRVRINAMDVSLTLEKASGTSILNILPAKVIRQHPVGEAQLNVSLALGADGHGPRILARITRRSWDALGLDVGRMVHAQVKGVALVEPLHDKAAPPSG